MSALQCKEVNYYEPSSIATMNLLLRRTLQRSERYWAGPRWLLYCWLYAEIWCHLYERWSDCDARDDAM